MQPGQYADVLLGPGEIPFRVGVGIEPEVNVALEGEDGLPGVPARERRLPGGVPVDVQFGQFAADAHEVGDIGGRKLAQLVDEFAGVVEKLRFRVLAGRDWAVVIQRLCGRDDGQHGVLAGRVRLDCGLYRATREVLEQNRLKIADWWLWAHSRLGAVRRERSLHCQGLQHCQGRACSLPEGAPTSAHLPHCGSSPYLDTLSEPRLASARYQVR